MSTPDPNLARNLAAARRFSAAVDAAAEECQRALASDDEHVIKAVDSCREQERALETRGCGRSRAGGWSCRAGASTRPRKDAGRRRRT